jgi:hypothetical protein
MLTDASTSALTGAVVWQIAQEEVQVLEEQAMASCGRSSLPGKPSSRTRLTTIWTEAWPGRPRLTELRPDQSDLYAPRSGIHRRSQW